MAMTVKERQEIINICSIKGISAKINCCERTVEYYILDVKDNKDRLAFRVSGKRANDIITQAHFAINTEPTDFALSQYLSCMIDYPNNKMSESERNFFD